MIKNYTSTVSAMKSINKIESILVRNGATDIAKQYDDQRRLSCIMFRIVRDGTVFPVKLPARVDAVARVLSAAVKRPRKETMDRIRDQAEKTAWKIVSDWVEIQFSMIELEQADLLEVFLPYLYNASSGSTFFEVVRDGGFKLLGDGSKSS